MAGGARPLQRGARSRPLTAPSILACVCFVVAAALYHAELHLLAFVTALIGVVLIGPFALHYLGISH
jgi:hypothetical protein